MYCTDMFKRSLKYLALSFPFFFIFASVFHVFPTALRPLFSWQVLIKQEFQRERKGYTIQVNEEHHYVQLDTFQCELNALCQFKVSVSKL